VLRISAVGELVAVQLERYRDSIRAQRLGWVAFMNSTLQTGREASSIQRAQFVSHSAGTVDSLCLCVRKLRRFHRPNSASSFPARKHRDSVVSDRINWRLDPCRRLCPGYKVCRPDSDLHAPGFVQLVSFPSTCLLHSAANCSAEISRTPCTLPAQITTFFWS